MVEVKQLRVILYERCGSIARQELRVPQDIFQKQDVGLHPSDLELVQGTLHLLNRVDVAVGPHYDLQITKICDSSLNLKGAVVGVMSPVLQARLGNVLSSHKNMRDLFCCKSRTNAP